MGDSIDIDPITAKKILVVSDIHGSWGILNELISKKQPDVILQVGDFGWWPHFHKKKGLMPRGELYNQFGIKNRLNNGGLCQIYWLRGNHSCADDLNCLTPDYKPLEIQDGITYCPFGTVLTINGYNVLFCGGAESTDKQYRIEGVSWWRDEIITQKDMDHLPERDDIDVVLSHTIPRGFFPYMPINGERYNDPSTMALQIVLEQYKPKSWASGHFHKFIKRRINLSTGSCNWISLSIKETGGTWWIDFNELV